jgi:hypothetical protein
MRYSFVILIATVCLAGADPPLHGNDNPTAATTASKAFSIHRLAWMTGRWEGPREGGILEEAWLPPRGKSVTAIVRLTKNDRTEFVEIIKIQEKGDSLELRLRLFDANLKPINKEPRVFTAAKQGKQSVTFRGVSPAAHRTLSYERPAPGRFVIRWETRQGKRTVIHLSDEKAKSEAGVITATTSS